MEELSKKELSDGLGYLITSDLNQVFRNKKNFESNFNYYFMFENKIYNVNLEIKED